VQGHVSEGLDTLLDLEAIKQVKPVTADTSTPTVGALADRLR
jgi:hypothetical protein